MTEALPPADAYYEMVEILGDVFFQTPPPSVGQEVVIQGKDHVHTVWAVPDALAIWLKPHIHNSPHLRWVSARAYDLASRAA